MSDSAYEILGVSRGSSAEEVKAAYRDLSKVWHPDRFANDPRLRRKAEEKLKDINRAYAAIKSGQNLQPPRGQNKDENVGAKTAGNPAARFARVALSFLFVLCLGAGCLLLIRQEAGKSAAGTPLYDSTKVTPGTGSQKDDSQPPQNGTGNPSKAKSVVQDPPSNTRPALSETSEAGNRNTTARAMPTVTVMIDPATNLIASAACPNRVRMTYPQGSEPREVCNLHKTQPDPDPDRNTSARSFKGIVKRAVSPSRWFKGRTESSPEVQPELPSRNQ